MLTNLCVINVSSGPRIEPEAEKKQRRSYIRSKQQTCVLPLRRSVRNIGRPFPDMADNDSLCSGSTDTEYESDDNYKYARNDEQVTEVQSQVFSMSVWYVHVAQACRSRIFTFKHSNGANDCCV